MDRDIRGDLAEFAENHHGMFRHQDALAAGFSQRQINYRLQRGLWVHHYEGVYRAAGAPLTWQGELLAACWAGGPSSVASHRSAAALLGLAGGSECILEITCPRWQRSRCSPLVVHQSKALDALDVTFVDRIPVTTVERTLLDLGAVSGQVTVLMAFDKAVRIGLTDWQRVNTALTRLARSGRPGVVKLRSALEQRRSRRVTESEMETLVDARLRAWGYPPPDHQIEIRDDEGTLVARADSGYRRWKIAIDYDSMQEHTDELALVGDAHRRNGIVAVGWSPMTVRYEDLRADGADLRRALDTLLRQKGFRRQ